MVCNLPLDTLNKQQLKLQQITQLLIDGNFVCYFKKFQNQNQKK